MNLGYFLFSEGRRLLQNLSVWLILQLINDAVSFEKVTSYRIE